MKQIENTLFYDIKNRQFIHAKEVHEDTVTFGGHCRFYTDAKTTIVRQELSIDYVIHNLIKADPVDKCPFVKFNKTVRTWEALKLEDNETDS